MPTFALDDILRLTPRPALVLRDDGRWLANAAFARAIAGGAIEAFTPLPGPAIWGSDWPEVDAIVGRIGAGEADDGVHDLEIEGQEAGRRTRRCHSCSFARLAVEGALLHVVCIDTTEQMNGRTRLALQHDLYEAMTAANEPRAAMRQVAAAIGRRWRVLAVGFAETDPATGTGALQVTAEWAADGLARFAGSYRLTDFGEAGETLLAGRPLSIEDVGRDARLSPFLRSVLEGAGVASVMAVLLLRDGGPIAGLFLADRQPRTWTPEDVALADDALQRTRELLGRLEAERDARDAKERMDLLERDGSQGLFDWNLETGAEYRSAGLGQLLGLETPRGGTVEAGGLARVLHPDDAPAMHAAVALALADGQDFVHEYRIRRADGEVRWLVTEARIVRAVDGRPLRMTGIVRDITERRTLAEGMEAAARRREFVTALGDRLRLPADPVAQMAAAAQTLADYFNVARVGFNEIRDGTTIALRRDLVNSDGAQPVDYPLGSYGADVVAALGRGETVAIDDVTTHPMTRDVQPAYLALGLRAIVAVPILKAGRLVATFDVNDPAPHAWTLEEIAASEIVAERAAAAAERARAEEALKENERLLRAIGDASADLIYAKDRDGRLLYANPATLAVIGLPAEAATGLAQREFTPDAQEGDAIAANDRLVVESGETHSFEEHFTTLAGDHRIYATTKSPLRDPDGGIIGLAGVSHDVTELRRAEAALVESEARFRTLADNIPVLCWMADPDGHIFWYNSRWYAYTGTGLVEMEGWGWQAVHDPAVLPEVMRRWQASLADGTPFEMVFPLRGADGAFRNFLTKVAPIVDGAGRVVRWFGTNTDVTEVEALRRTEALHELILESATEFAIVATDLDGRVTSWNAGAETLFGRSAADMLGQAVDRPGLPALFAGSVPAPVSAGAAARGRSDHEGEIVRPDGRAIWVSGSTMPLRGADGGQIGYLAILRDRSAERRQEEHRRLLVDELNHRVKNTLAIVQGMAQQSFRAVPEAMPARRGFEQRLAALASAHALLTRESWEAADIRDIVADMLKTHDPDGRRIVAAGPSARFDPQTSVTLAMMLHELVTNARKYGALSTEQGQVDLGWSALPVPASGIVLDWVERGGPPVTPPAARGFGSRLIERAFPAGDPNSATLSFEPDGVRCRIVVEARGTAGR
jgi:PAS domain S-box-containing protein